MTFEDLNGIIHIVYGEMDWVYEYHTFCFGDQVSKADVEMEKKIKPTCLRCIAEEAR